MIVIHPSDPTTRFLSNIIDELRSKSDTKIEFPNWQAQTAYESLKAVKKTSSMRTIIYMGHGGPEELNGNNGMDTAISLIDARTAFENRKVILLSCNSAEFLAGVGNRLEVGIGFGNIPTSMQELSPSDNLKYRPDSYRCISLFRERLVELFSSSLIEGYLLNSNFYDLYNGLKLRINKSICHSSISTDSNERLAGELMFNLKKEMKIYGNGFVLLKSEVF